MDTSGQANRDNIAEPEVRAWVWQSGDIADLTHLGNTQVVEALTV